VPLEPHGIEDSQAEKYGRDQNPHAIAVVEVCQCVGRCADLRLMVVVANIVLPATSVSRTRGLCRRWRSIGLLLCPVELIYATEANAVYAEDCRAEITVPDQVTTASGNWG
jgi:hypothetical protein